MPDFRIAAGKTASDEKSRDMSLVEALIHRADDIASRYKLVASNFPYRNFSDRLLDDDVSSLAAQLAAATWKRVGEEVPSYAFAEKVGRRYREAGGSIGALLLHWQILRRSIHLTLADWDIRTGRGNEDRLRQASFMNYTVDWAIEASLVAYAISAGPEDETI